MEYQELKEKIKKKVIILNERSEGFSFKANRCTYRVEQTDVGILKLITDSGVCLFKQIEVRNNTIAFFSDDKEFCFFLYI
jgi:hypothetical protein